MAQVLLWDSRFSCHPRYQSNIIKSLAQTTGLKLSSSFTDLLRKGALLTLHAHNSVPNIKILEKNNQADLVVVVMAVKKWLFAEYHTGKHAAETPHVQRVVIHLSTKEISIASKLYKETACISLSVLSSFQLPWRNCSKS